MLLYSTTGLHCNEWKCVALIWPGKLCAKCLQVQYHLTSDGNEDKNTSVNILIAIAKV